jgi:hypothetical protein
MAVKLSNIYSEKFRRAKWNVYFTSGKYITIILDALLWPLGYTYRNAAFRFAEADVSVFDIQIRNISLNITEAILRRNGLGYGLVRRLKLDEQGRPYSGKEYGNPVQYWQFGKFMILTIRQIYDVAQERQIKRR